MMGVISYADLSGLGAIQRDQYGNIIPEKQDAAFFARQRSAQVSAGQITQQQSDKAAVMQAVRRDSGNPPSMAYTAAEKTEATRRVMVAADRSTSTSRRSASTRRAVIRRSAPASAAESSAETTVTKAEGKALPTALSSQAAAGALSQTSGAGAFANLLKPYTLSQSRLSLDSNDTNSSVLKWAAIAVAGTAALVGTALVLRRIR